MARGTALQKKYVPSKALAKIVGTKPLTRGEATSRVWADYKAGGMSPELKAIVGPKMDFGAVAKSLSKHLLEE